jgi:hypothetical protein
VFTIDGVDYTTATNAAGQNVTIVSKAAPAGMFKYEIKFNQLGSKAALGNGLHTVALYAAAQNGKCYQSIWTFTINNAPKAQQTGSCQEDLFRGGTNLVPANGAQVSYGTVVKATYFDETSMFRYSGSDLGTRSHNLLFNIDPDNNTPAGPSAESPANIQALDKGPGPVGGPAGANWTFTQFDSMNPAPGELWRFDTTGTGGGEYKFATYLKYTLPDLGVGTHVFYLRAYDSDQNKAGGDCGIAQWTVNFAVPAGRVGSVELID